MSKVDRAETSTGRKVGETYRRRCADEITDGTIRIDRITASRVIVTEAWTFPDGTPHSHQSTMSDRTLEAWISAGKSGAA